MSTASTWLPGLPNRAPFARAFRRPGFTRSAIKPGSNSATRHKTVKTNLAARVNVSACSDSEINSIPEFIDEGYTASLWQ